MSEEEKKAIEFIKDELNKEKEWGKKTSNDYKRCSDLYGNGDVEILLNLIEKQQKEIEELKDREKELKELRPEEENVENIKGDVKEDNEQRKDLVKFKADINEPISYEGEINLLGE